MANVKISQLPSLSTMTNVAQIPVVAGGTTYQITGANLATFFGTTPTKISNGTTEANIGVSGGNANISVGGVSNVAVFATTGLTVNGGVSAPYLVTNSIRSDDSSFVNVEDGLNITGAVVASGNITGGNLSGTNIAGSLTTNAQANITTVGTLGNLAVSGQANVTQQINTARVSATGNITGNYFIGNGSLLTGIVANTGNVTFSGEIVIGTGTSNLISGLYLAPSSSSANANMYLRVRGNVIDEPTHIHFDTGNNAYYNQFIGDDNKYILLANTGNIVINANNNLGNSAQWTFGTDGTLIVPAANGVPGKISTATTQASEKGFDLRITAGNTGGCSVSGGDVYLSAGVGYNGISHGGGNVNIVTGDRYGNIVGNIWNFGSTGILTLPLGGVKIKDTVGNSVAFGLNAGFSLQGIEAVAIGSYAGNNRQGNNSVAIGNSAGAGGSVSTNYVSGAESPSTTLVVVSTTGIGPGMIISGTGFFGNITVVTVTNSTTLEISASAGFTPSGTLTFTGNQGANAVAIGQGAGSTNQGTGAVAIGARAGLTNQGNNSIIVNATGANLDQTTANTFTVAPVRNDVANTANVMFYNATSKEITYGNVVSVAGNITGGNILTGSRVVTTPVAFSTLTAVTGARAFVNDGNLVAATNFGAQVSGSGSNTVPVWSDGTNWYIG